MKDFKLTRREFNKLALSAALLPSFGCSYLSRPDYLPKVLRLNLGFEPESLDWLQATDSYSFDVIANIMAGLTKYNNELQSVPSIAKSWEISEDSKTYTFYLDENAKWSDGKPVLADDFVFSWQRILDPKTAGPYAYLMYPIKNAQKFNTGEIKDPHLLGVEAVDNLTFKVELESPLAFFLNITSYCFAFPQRRDIIEKYGDDWTKPGNLISCGPFVLKDRHHEYKMTLERNPHYTNPIPKLEEIKYYIVPEQSSAFALYMNNEIDWIDSRSVPISEISTVKKMKDTSFQDLLRNIFVGFNVNKPPFDNPKVRAAFSHSIDRNIFPKILGRGEVPSATLVPPGLKDFYLPDVGRAYNPKKARRLLKEAGFANGKGFPKVSMLYPTREDVKVYVEAIQQQWKDVLNIDVKLVNEEWKVYLSTLHEDPPHIFRMSWGADYPDPDTFMNLFTSSSGNNMGKWKNKEYDRIILKASQTLDIEERKSLYKRAQEILLVEDTAIAPLFFNTQIFLNKPWVKNIEFNAMDVVFCEKIEVS